nr:uncharacterized protein LOC109168613 isoform X1 [Ipomoea batatas]
MWTSEQPKPIHKIPVQCQLFSQKIHKKTRLSKTTFLQEGVINRQQHNDTLAIMIYRKPFGDPEVSSRDEPCTEVDVEKETVPQSVTSLHHQLESSSSSTEVEESCDEEKEKYVTPKYFIRFNRSEKQCFKRRMFTLAGRSHFRQSPVEDRIEEALQSAPNQPAMPRALIDTSARNRHLTLTESAPKSIILTIALLFEADASSGSTLHHPGLLVLVVKTSGSAFVQSLTILRLL